MQKKNQKQVRNHFYKDKYFFCYSSLYLCEFVVCLGRGLLPASEADPSPAVARGRSPEERRQGPEGTPGPGHHEAVPGRGVALRPPGGEVIELESQMFFF